MKTYTDISQSKKLAEILPIESADIETIEELQEDYGNQIIPCWSLSALLNYIKDKCGYFELVYLSSTIDGKAKLEDVYRLSTDVYDVYKKDAVDACYEMIIKLYEQKLL